MRKILVSLLILASLSGIAWGADMLDDLKKSPLYPAEYWITTDYNPDKNRDWQFGEVSNGFKWKVKKDEKMLFLLPDEYTLAWDYNPNGSERAWQCDEITVGGKWNLK